MKKLDQSKVEYIVAEKRKGTRNYIIAETMGISVRCVQKLWVKFKNTPKDKIIFPAPMGRPRRGSPTRAEQSAVLSARAKLNAGANVVWHHPKNLGYTVPKHVVHEILEVQAMLWNRNASRNAESG